MDEWKDPIIIPQHVKEQMAADPELAAGCQEIFALMRQAHAAWQDGKYNSLEEALNALGIYPEPFDGSSDSDINV